MRGYSDELRIRPTDETLLKQVTEVSGGQYNPSAAELFEPTDAIANRPTPLWPWLLTAAAFLLILDVALRRIDIDLHWTRWTGSSLVSSD